MGRNLGDRNRHSRERTMTFTRKEVINFIVQAIESGYTNDLFKQNFVDDGDDIMDYMETNINQKEFDIWCEKNIPK